MSEAATGDFPTDADGDVWLCGAEPKHGKMAVSKQWLEEKLGFAVVDGTLQTCGDVGKTKGALGIGGEQPAVIGGIFHAGEEHEGEPMSGVPGVNHASDGVSETSVADDLIKDSALSGEGANLGVIGDETGSVDEVIHDDQSGSATAEPQPSTTEASS